MGSAAGIFFSLLKLGAFPVAARTPPRVVKPSWDVVQATCSSVASADVVRGSAAKAEPRRAHITSRSTTDGSWAYGLRPKFEGGVVKLRLKYRVEVEFGVEP